MTFRDQILERFTHEFGQPSRQTVKIVEWSLGAELSAVVQLDQPARGQSALVWLPYPAEGATVPEIALEYPGESGRHSNTHAAPRLKRGLPALRLNVTSQDELDATVAYIFAMRDSRPLPEAKVPARPTEDSERLSATIQIGARHLSTPKCRGIPTGYDG
jgi:hypothetical protein